MEDLILRIFYQDIVPSVSKKDFVEIDGWRFNVEFNILFNDNELEQLKKFPQLQGNNTKSFMNEGVSECLIINDINGFNDALVEYTITMLNHINEYKQLQDIDYIYYDGNINNIIKMILLNVWFNATVEDFKNPINFLNLRKLILQDKISKENLDCVFQTEPIQELNNNLVRSTITIQNPSANETPYVFRTSVVNPINNIEFYTLPDISYGIVEDNCYIYAIHGSKRKQLNDYEKKINRLLFKANKNFIDDYTEESIKDISLSQLFSMTAFLKFLNSNGIKHIVVKNYFPVRYNAKVKANQRKLEELERKKATLIKEDYENQRNNLINDADLIQSNITNKYIRVIRRLMYHFNNLEITSYPYELDDSMHINLDDSVIEDENHILYDIYQKLNYITKTKDK